LISSGNARNGKQQTAKRKVPALSRTLRERRNPGR
jgi:hypothetical protein